MGPRAAAEILSPYHIKTCLIGKAPLLFSVVPREGVCQCYVKRPAQRVVKGIVGSATFSFDLSCAGGATDVFDNRRSVSR